MEWLALLQLTVVALFVVAQLPAIRRHWLENREEAARGWRIAAYYLAYCIAGLAILISALVTATKPADAFLAGCVFFIAWVTLGVSWMLKVTPKAKRGPKTPRKTPPEAPQIVQPLNALDFVAIAAIAGSLPFLLTL